METLLLWPEGAPGALGLSDEDCPAITPYLVEGGNNAAVLICPGGAYWLRADHEGGPVAEWLNTLGISAFVLRYRVAPYRYPSALLDAQRALRTIRYRAEEFGIDSERVGILGFSAGGHLASTASGLFDRGNKETEEALERESCRPDFSILCYPVISMTDGVTHEGSRENLLGANPPGELIRRLSGELQVTPDSPPAFLWHTADDAAVPVENSLLLASALRRSQIPFDLHVYAHGEHGLGLAEEEPHTCSWTNACASWLQMNGYAK